MHQLIQAHGWLPTLTRETPTAVGALVVAEFLYKFHSFTLECLAFLATWYAFSWIANQLFRSQNDKQILSSKR